MPAEKRSAEEVKKILLNPVYTMGSKAISDDQWIQTQRRLLAELGEEGYFQELLAVLKATFGQFVVG